MRILILLAVLMLTAAPVFAQGAQSGNTTAEPNGGLAFVWHLPQKELKETHDKGYGIHLLFAYGLAERWDFTATVGWNRLLATTEPHDAHRGSTDITMWEFTAGPRIRLAWFYGGVEGGYFTKLDKWGWVPNAGVRWKIFDLGWRWNATGENEIHSIRLGVFFE